MSPLADSMVTTSRAEASHIARARGMMKKSWISIKSKLKNIHRVKRPIRVVSSPGKQVEIDPSLKEAVGVVPSLQEVAPSIDLSASEDDRTRTHPIHTEPPCTSLSSFPGLKGFEGALISSPGPKQANLGEAHPVILPNPTPKANGHPETVSQRQGSGSDDSVGSNEAVFGDTQNASTDMADFTPNQPQDSPIEIPHVQKAPVLFTPSQNPLIRAGPVQMTPTRNTPIQVQRPLPNQVKKKVELANLAIPGLTPMHYPGLLPPSLTPSPQSKIPGLHNAQLKTPAVPANLFLSPSPVMIVSNLDSPSSHMPPTPSTPNIPATPIKHQGRIPEIIGQMLNVVPNQPPPLLPRSPKRPSPYGLDPVSTAGGERDLGVIGDRRMFKNQPQPQIVGEPKDEPKRHQESLAEVKLTPECNVVDGARDQEDRDAKPQFARQRYYTWRHLGDGGMGKVYSVINMDTMSLAALKVIERKRSPNGFATVKGEWTVLKAISEVKYFSAKRNTALGFVHHLMESWYDKENVYFVTPLCICSLHDQLKAVKLDHLTIRVYAAELMCGLEALHDMRIMHCDLKPDNILVSSDGHLSISDFGLSVSWLDPRYQAYPLYAFRGRVLAGTEGYMAPEIIIAIQDPNMLRRGNFGFAADIWSLGVVIAELGMRGSRFVAFEDQKEEQHWRGNRKEFARTMVLSHEMLARRIEKYLRGDHMHAMLVERMIEIEEASRADFDEIAAHPFFSNLDVVKVLNRGYPVPAPPFEGVLPCQHTDADERLWMGGQDESRTEEGSEHDEIRALCLMADADRWIIPEGFIWDINKGGCPIGEAQ